VKIPASLTTKIIHMKKSILSTLLFASLALVAAAEDKKLEGTATCAKCDLGLESKCRAALVVKGADGKDVVYLADANAEAKKLHSEICEGGKPAKVEGTVAEKDGAKVITITKFELK
jgi:hypothetical protein